MEPLIVAATASPPLCTPSGVCWENPFPSASSVGFDALASTTAGSVAVGSGGNILRIRGGELDLLEPTGHDLDAVVAVSESHAFVAGDLGYLADLDIANGSRSVKERAFPDISTGPVFSMAALGPERVFLSSLFGAITEWTPRGYVRRSVRSHDVARLAQAGTEIVASYGYTVSAIESAREPWTERFAMPVMRAIVVDGVRAFALGEHGALYERSAEGWSTTIEWPETLSAMASFQDVAVVHRAGRTPLVLAAMGRGNVLVREGFSEDGGTFEEELVPWAADPGAHLRRLVVLEDGTVLGVGSILAARSPDGVWRGERPTRHATYYAVVRSGPSEAWAAGGTGELARYVGGHWERYTRATVTGNVVSLVASASVPGEIHGITTSGSEWLVRSVDGTLRRDALPTADVWRSLLALPDGRFVAGGNGKVLYREGEEFRIQELAGSWVLCLTNYANTIVFADGNAVFELTPGGTVRLLELPSTPDSEDPPVISALHATAGGEELFIGTAALGVYRFANGRLTVERPIDFEGPRADLRPVDDVVASFSSGPSGFYMATARGEILRRTAPRRFSRVPKDPFSDGDEVNSLLDANGSLYALGRVVWRLEGGRFTVLNTGALQLESGVSLPSGDVLVGGYAGTLIRIPVPRTPTR